MEKFCFCFKKFWNKTKTFRFFPVFLQVLLQPLLALSWPLLHSHASIDILRDLFKPLTASKTSQGLYRHSHGLYWHSHASTDTLTASKALSRPLQSTSTQLACNREFTSTFSWLWVLLRPWVLCTLAASLGSPTITMGTLTVFISTLMASTGIFMNLLLSHGLHWYLWVPANTLTLLQQSQGL